MIFFGKTFAQKQLEQKGRKYDRVARITTMRATGAKDDTLRCPTCGAATVHHCGMGACVEMCPKCDVL